mmetsp:Transcript_20120/g.30257  ORF Transcript_20120/g.30257 Transcript_20120/m.30257 type:complete len:88 (+) Transcript_20120:125-388(+)
MDYDYFGTNSCNQSLLRDTTNPTFVMTTSISSSSVAAVMLYTVPPKEFLQLALLSSNFEQTLLYRLLSWQKMTISAKTMPQLKKVVE